ncbi:MAG TPA: dipeptidase [Gemmatimonadales bacterium]|nr:dipeptidase [Gemmatimonadales bacterium]
MVGLRSLFTIEQYVMTSDLGGSDQQLMLRELSEFLSIPSISTLPSHTADCRRAAEWLQGKFRRLGCPVVELLEGPGHPVVWAEGPAAPGRPTLLIYGHYDVQPPDPLEEWATPPFEPTVRDGKLFARGAADDKGQVYCLLKAWEAASAAGGTPPLNVRFLIEGEEECGGDVIAAVLERDPWRVEADAVVVCDMSYYAPGWPAVYTALRGMCYCEIQVRTLQRDLHSGTYGGVAPNALETLTRLLASLKSADGTINIPGLYEQVIPPTAAELSAWRQLPFNTEQYLAHEITGKALTGLVGRSVMERTWALPTFEIHGIRGGFVGEGAKTVIPAAATAKVSLRLVPGLTFAGVRDALTHTVQALAPAWADVTVTAIHGADPVQVDVSNPVFKLLDQAFEEVAGRPAIAVRAGGSIPVVAQLGKRGAPVILTGIGLPDDGLHSPNEKLDLQQLWDGVRVFGRFFELMGAM